MKPQSSHPTTLFTQKENEERNALKRSNGDTFPFADFMASAIFNYIDINS